MKYRNLVPTELAAIKATLKAMPAIVRHHVPTCMRVYGAFVPEMKALRKLGYKNKAIAAAIYEQTNGRVGPTHRPVQWGPVALDSTLAAQYISGAINYRAR